MKKLFSVALLLILCACPSSLSEALRQYGYLPVRPASALWLPGSVVFIKHRAPLEVGFVCTAKQLMGPNFHPMESITTNSELSRAGKKGFTMATHIQDIVTADAEMSSIKSVKLNLKNVKVLELTDLDIVQALQNVDKRCIRAIQRRREQGFDVTLISAAIQADLIYSVSFERSSKLDVDAKVAAVQNLSAKLGVDASRTTESAIMGQGLVFGIRSDEYLAWQLDPTSLPKADRGSSILSADTQEELQVLLGNPTVVPPPKTHAEPQPDVVETYDDRWARQNEAETDFVLPEPEPEPDEDDDLTPLPAPRPQPVVPRNRSNRQSASF